MFRVLVLGVAVEDQPHTSTDSLVVEEKRVDGGELPVSD